MSQQSSNSQTLSVALLTVALDRDLSDKIGQAISQHQWTVTHNDFDEYVSAARRPAISADAKAADLVVAIIDFDRDPRAPRRPRAICSSCSSESSSPRPSPPAMRQSCFSPPCARAAMK